MLNGIQTAFLFFRQFLRAPAQTGSLCPSSRFLARALANAALENDMGGLLVDLGSGSGVISRELLRLGVSPRRILAVDISECLVPLLRKQCGTIRFRAGDARNLGLYLGEYPCTLRVQAILSSLPLRTMPERMLAETMREIHSVLHDRGGVFVQYTYALWQDDALSTYGFQLRANRIVPMNMPPALVETYCVSNG